MDILTQLPYLVLLLGGTVQSTAAQNLCPGYWNFHASTGTCFQVFTDDRTFDGARQACQKHLGGPDQNYPGWLAGIHDINTDAFVKSLLRQGQKAYIGLYKNTFFYWIDRTPYKSSFKGWIVGEPYYDCAFITKTSWETTDEQVKLDYICQMHAMFPKPTLGCEPMRIGATFSPLTCQVAVHESFGSFNKIEMKNSRHDRLIKCWPDMKCEKSEDFVTARISPSRTTISTTVTIDRRVTRSDDRIQWDCVYQFMTTPNGFLSTSCNMQVYNTPSDLKCRYTISEELYILCETEGVYPQAESYLEHYVDETWRGKWSWSNAEHTKYFDDNLLFYRSKFQMRITDQMNEGNHKITVVVFPSVAFSSRRKKNEASESYSFEFAISAPTKPPMFSTGNDLDIVDGKLIAMERANIHLICNVPGGNPSVFKTQIVCDNGVGDPQERDNWHSQNQKAEANFVVSRLMNKKSCTCSAQHMSRQYKATSTIELDIRYRVEISVFKLNDMQDEEIELREGETANFKCTATGNPKPNLHIFQMYNNGKSSKSLENKSNSEELFVQIKASGEMSGMYICSAHNNLNTEVQARQIHLMVKSRPKSCSRRDFDRQFSATEGREVHLEICVYAYPPISSLELARQSVLRREDYEINFKYTHSDEARAVVSVTIRAPQVFLDEFQIYTTQEGIGRSKMTFDLVPYMKPSCPESLDVVLVGRRFTTLSWQPAFDRGIPQTFSLSTLNAENKVINEQDIEDNGETVMSYNTTNLEPHSIYRFILRVKNDQGVTECPHLAVNITTEAGPASDGYSGYVTVGTVIGVVIFIIIIIVVVIIVVFILIARKKKKTKNQDNQVYSEIVKTSTHQGGKKKQDVKEMNSKGQSQSNIYNNQVAMEEKASGHNQDFIDSSEKEKFKSPKPQPSPRKSRAEGDTAITSTDANNKDNALSKEGINNGKIFNGKAKPSKSKVKKGTVKDSKATQKNSVALKEANKELVYIEVEIVPKKEGISNKHPEIVEESVTYASVNFNAIVKKEAPGETDDVVQTEL
ncbi:hypothetical protein RRG08_063502 [Elysia crispata]|uniref:Uncharacterized protein n=1 Tax=Elysia crispata TaxID=231223 RepID=A0AAE1EAZ5_9GAST|nr:hypothetical protein RRG08_063502 [Elysia crispata]